MREKAKAAVDEMRLASREGLESVIARAEGVDIERIVEDILVFVGRLIIATVAIVVVGLAITPLLFKMFEWYSILIMES